VPAQSSACGTTANAKSIQLNNGTKTALPALVSYMQSGRLSFRREAWVRLIPARGVASANPSPQSSPLGSRGEAARIATSPFRPTNQQILFDLIIMRGCQNGFFV